MEKTCKHFSHGVTSGGLEEGGGGGVPNYKNVDNKPERDCFTNQAEYSQSCDHVGSRLVMEHSMMKSSTLFKSRPLPLYVHLMST